MAKRPTPTPPDRRLVQPRFQVGWRATLRCSSWGFASRIAALNASEGGMFLGTPRPPAPGTRVELTVALPNGKQLRVRGTVQHVVTAERALTEGIAPGAGVKIDPEHQDDMRELVRLATTELARPGSDAPPGVPSHGPAPAGLPDRSAQIAADLEAVLGPPAENKARARSGAVAEAIGMSLGLSTCSVSAAIGESLYVLPDPDGQLFQATSVAYLGDLGPIVGAAARASLASQPSRVISGSPRYLGRSFDDPEIAGALYAASHGVQAAPDGSIRLQAGGLARTPEEVCAESLRHLAWLAGKALGVLPRKVMLSCPALATEAERAALERAVALADLDLLGLIEEPLAGTLAWGLRAQPGEILAVYDFGGGSFKFSLIEAAKGKQTHHHRLMGTGRDLWLGGDDFDTLIAAELADRFWSRTHMEVRQRVDAWQRLVLACERAKRRLSTEPVAEVDVPGLIVEPRPMALQELIERSTFEAWAGELVARSLEVCNEVLAASGLRVDRISEVVLIGGAARMPLVRQAVSALFGRPVQATVDPGEAVVLGAGLSAAAAVHHKVARYASFPQTLVARHPEERGETKGEPGALD